MKKFILHAYGLDGIQITEAQRDNIAKLCNSADGANKMISVNGYMIRVSAIATIEPTDEMPKPYLVEQYNKEAARGLHEPYQKRLKASEMLADEQAAMVEEVLDMKREDRSYMWQGSPNRGNFTSLHDYIKAKNDFMKKIFRKGQDG